MNLLLNNKKFNLFKHKIIICGLWGVNPKTAIKGLSLRGKVGCIQKNLPLEQSLGEY